MSLLLRKALRGGRGIRHEDHFGNCVGICCIGTVRTFFGAGAAADDPAEIQDTDGEYDNDMSLVAKVICGEKKFLFTGDIEKTRIAQMLDSGEDWTADWIKMPHHGRYQKKVEKLLEAVNPFYAVICDGEDQPAEEETLDALKKRQIKEWETADGTVVTITDGKNIKVRQENE